MFLGDPCPSIGDCPSIRDNTVHIKNWDQRQGIERGIHTYKSMLYTGLWSSC